MARLLVPGSLSIIESSFVPADRGGPSVPGRAWGVATAVGPLAGGWLVTVVSWRLIFVLNLPLAVLVMLASCYVPDSRDPDAERSIDLRGAALVVVGLAGVTDAVD